MADVIQIRRDTAANWTSADPTLAQGEIGFETDTKKLKVGDGSTAWSSLGYYTLGVTGYAAYADATANFTGTLQNGGSNVVVDTDIGSTVQAYDADTAKYDDVTANFTGTLQNGGSNVVVDTDIGSTVQAYDADTAKLDTAQTWTANQKFLTTTETYATASSSSGALTIDTSTGTVFSVTLTENVTSSTFSNPPSTGTAYGFTLKLIQDSVARTVTWPTSVDWAAATAPTLSSGSGEVDVFTFFTHDGGTTWYGFTAGQVMS